MNVTAFGREGMGPAAKYMAEYPAKVARYLGTEVPEGVSGQISGQVGQILGASIHSASI